MIFRIKGRVMINPILFWKSITKTFPNEIAIMIYNTDHTGPNNHDGGAHDGLINCEYHS